MSSSRPRPCSAFAGALCAFVLLHPAAALEERPRNPSAPFAVVIEQRHDGSLSLFVENRSRAAQPLSSRVFVSDAQAARRFWDRPARGQHPLGRVVAGGATRDLLEPGPR
jgi:hypothetical protein